MSTTLDRGKLTDALLAALEAHVEDFAVGDGEAPANAGWVGQANAPTSTFRPYLVLSGTTATRSQGTFNDPQDTWQLPYTLVGIGVTRRQCDLVMNLGLGALTRMKKQRLTLGPGPQWKVLDVASTGLGMPRIVGGQEPPYWQRDDGLSFFITKELG